EPNKVSDFVKFVRLSKLQTCNTLPTHAELKGELVDYRDIRGFTLSGPLSMWRGKNILATTPCIFVSHRWQLSDHPDPDGSHLRIILDRLKPVIAQAQNQGADDVYLWIDFCCLPQRTEGRALSPEDGETLQAGLAQLTEILKSCDLMVLDSPDYTNR